MQAAHPSCRVDTSEVGAHNHASHNLPDTDLAADNLDSTGVADSAHDVQPSSDDNEEAEDPSSHAVERGDNLPRSTAR